MNQAGSKVVSFQRASSAPSCCKPWSAKLASGKRVRSVETLNGWAGDGCERMAAAEGEEAACRVWPMLPICEFRNDPGGLALVVAVTDGRPLPL